MECLPGHLPTSPLNFSMISIISACVNEHISAMLTLVLVCFGSEACYALVSVHSYERILPPRFSRIWKKHKATIEASDLPFPLPAPPTKKRKKPTLHKDYYFYNNVARFIA